MSITGDAWEYMKLLKDSLLAEVEHQVEANDDYRSRLKEAMTCYWDMFSHGSTDYITRCHQCGISSTREQPFTELMGEAICHRNEFIY